MYCQSAQRNVLRTNNFDNKDSLTFAHPYRKIILIPILLKGLSMLKNVRNFVLYCVGQTVCSECNREQVVKFLIALSNITFLNTRRTSKIFKFSVSFEINNSLIFVCCKN
jgi:hypothetical protein